MDQYRSIGQHSLGPSILFHLAPGLLIGGAYFALIPLVHRLGYPSLMALICAIAAVLVPVELGWLLSEGKKKNGRPSLQGVVLYRVSIPIWQYFLWVPSLFVLLGVIFTLMKPVDSILQQALFAWMPVLESGLQGGYSPEALMATCGLAAIFVMGVGPLVEEWYFRGYLLPRMGYAGQWAPLLHSLVFELYHG